MSKVSIIVPVYNVKKNLDECIESLTKQTFHDIEIILVNDGSNDGSAEVCTKWGLSDNRIKVIHQKNQGVSVARNNGIKNASGEWISFVDGDDYVSYDMIEKLFDETKRSDNVDLIIGSYYSHKNNKIFNEHFFGEDRIINSEDKEILVKMAVGINVVGITGETNIGVPWGKLYRSNVINEYGIKFKPGLKRMQDTVFNIAFFRVANEIRYINIPLYYYRIWDNSVVRKYSADFEYTAKDVVTALEKEIYLYNNIEDKNDIIQYKKFILLIETIRLIYIRKECNLSLKQKVQNIKRLCESSFYYSAIHSFSGVYLSNKTILLKKLLKFRFYYITYLMLYIKYYFIDNKT